MMVNKEIRKVTVLWAMNNMFLMARYPLDLIKGIFCSTCISLLLSKGQTVVKCICECNQSRRRVIFDPKPVAMSTVIYGCRGVLRSKDMFRMSHMLWKRFPRFSSDFLLETVKFSPVQSKLSRLIQKSMESIVLYHSLMKEIISLGPKNITTLSIP